MHFRVFARVHLHIVNIVNNATQNVHEGIPVFTTPLVPPSTLFNSMLSPSDLFRHFRIFNLNCNHATTRDAPARNAMMKLKIKLSA